MESLADLLHLSRYSRLGLGELLEGQFSMLCLNHDFFVHINLRFLDRISSSYSSHVNFFGRDLSFNKDSRRISVKGLKVSERNALRKAPLLVGRVQVSSVRKGP